MLRSSNPPQFENLPLISKLALGVLSALTLGLVYLPGQQDFELILALFIPAFALYLWLYRQADPGNLTFFLAAAVVIRLMLLPAQPNLSDDIYRFIWDGRLIIHGYNPFDHLPVFYLSPENRVPGLTAELYSKLNSQQYFTVYPPVAQGVFALASWIFPQNEPGATVVIRGVLVAFEAGTIWLLPRLLAHWNIPRERALLYALNPLVILEITGNLHFEGAMVFFFVAGLRLLQIGRTSGAALAMAGAVGSKLIPLMFFPFFIRRLLMAGSQAATNASKDLTAKDWARMFLFFLLSGAAILLLFIPLLNGVFFRNIGKSLALYFRQFEFNASWYYIERWLGFQITGYNQIALIGPPLALLAAGFVLLLSLTDRGKDWKSMPVLCMWAILFYLGCTTTVHPWYLILPLMLSLFSRWRFPVLWSGLIVLSYAHYWDGAFRENYGLIAFEYIAVGGYLMWEVLRWEMRRV